MVLKLQLWTRRRLPPLIAIALGALCAWAAHSHAAEPATPEEYLKEARNYYSSGQYFKSARYAFAADDLWKAEGRSGGKFNAEAYAWISASLVHAGLYNGASYFFIRTLQSGDNRAIRRVLMDTQELLVHVGADLLRKYLIRHTTYEDYDSSNRSAYLYSLAREALLSNKPERAIGYVNSIHGRSPLWPFALQLRGASNAILGNGEAALRDFSECSSRAGEIAEGRTANDSVRKIQIEREGEDLKARCAAGYARTLYQMDRFEEADRAYDAISKSSLVWPDILFEQAWNSFAKNEFNRTLGKLVTYKSPALRFIFNSETDLLRAQTFLALCLYSDANDVINEFNSRYTRVGEEVKRFVEGNAQDLNAFYNFGAEALRASLYTSNDMYRFSNRFIRGPYFQNLLLAERDTNVELSAVNQFDTTQPGVTHDPAQGFPGFLRQVLRWRIRTIRLLGGAFVKNSMIDYHEVLLADFEKIAFVKLEMLKRAKEALIYKNSSHGDRMRGNVEPRRRDDQFYWSFNGEFWADELGDYVFGLESECRQ